MQFTRLKLGDDSTFILAMIDGLPGKNALKATSRFVPIMANTKIALQPCKCPCFLF